MGSLERNIPLLYGYSILIKRVSMPIIIIYFLLNNLNFTQIGILGAVIAIFAVAFEVHGGVFADTFGRKNSLILHSIFAFLTMFFYFIGDSFFYFLIASVFYGLSGAFISGTRTSLMYDTLLKMKREKEFKKSNSRMVLYSHVVNALVLLVIPLIYAVNVKLPFVIGMGFFAGSIAVALLISETISRTPPKKIILSSFKEITGNKKALFAIVFMAIIGSFVFIPTDYIQPLLQISGLEVVYFGIIYAFMRILMGLGGEVTHRLRYSSETMLIVGILIIFLSFSGFLIGSGLIIIISVLLLKFGEGFNRIILEDEINKNINSENRTTILSITNLSKNTIIIALAISFGISADLVGVQGIFGYAILAFFLAILAGILLVKKR